MTIATMMNTEVDIKRPVPDYDDMGGVVYNTTTIESFRPCRISSEVPSEVSSGPKEWAEATAIVYMEPGITLDRDDELHHGNDVYIVLGARMPSVPSHHFELICKRKTYGS